MFQLETEEHIEQTRHGSRVSRQEKIVQLSRKSQDQAAASIKVIEDLASDAEADLERAQIQNDKDIHHSSKKKKKDKKEKGSKHVHLHTSQDKKKKSAGEVRQSHGRNSAMIEGAFPTDNSFLSN